MTVYLPIDPCFPIKRIWFVDPPFATWPNQCWIKLICWKSYIYISSIWRKSTRKLRRTFLGNLFKTSVRRVNLKSNLKFRLETLDWTWPVCRIVRKEEMGRGTFFRSQGWKLWSRSVEDIASSKYRRNNFWKKFIPRLERVFFFLYIYGELSRAISRGWANNCVYPIGVGSNVVLTTRRCRESYADQRWETRFSFDDIKIKLHGTLAIFLSWQSFFCKVTFNIWTKDQLNYNPFKRVSITFQNNMVNFNGKYIGKKWKVLRENMLER